MISERKVSRREFMRLSTLTTAGLVAAACGVSAPAPAAVEDSGETEAPQTSTQGQSVEAPPPAAASKYQEAPMLAELVQNGQLPPVDERVPVNPLVLTGVVHPTGNFGGTIRRGFKGVSDRWGPTKLMNESLTWYVPDDLSIRPNIAESWEVNEDATEWTFNLREGMKWSDGHPFDSESFQWWYDYRFNNETLSPAISTRWSTGDPRIKMEMGYPDATTVTMKFAHPKPLFGFDVTRSQPFTPGHYMAQYHIDLVDDPAALEAKVQEVGLETWDQYYVDREFWYLNQDMPNISPWIADNPLSEELFIMKRNPYFWQVDAEGKQLPYLDNINHRLFESNDVFDLWIVGGEIDFQNRHVSAAKFTIYKQNEESGGYKIMLGSTESQILFHPNHAGPDPKLREFFGTDPRVRIALSHAVNRQELNDLAFDGIYTVRQYSPDDSSPQYYEKLTNAYVEYDPDLANQLLDEAGYTERDSDGFRMNKDGSGETVNFIVEGTAQPGTPDEDAILYILNAFAEVGVKGTYKGEERSLYSERWAANEVEAVFWGGGRGLLPILTPTPWIGTEHDRPWSGAWGKWKSNPNDPLAEEPPEGHFLWDIWDLWAQVEVEVDEAKRTELFHQMLDIWHDNLPVLGFLGNIPALFIVKDGLQNWAEGYPSTDGIENAGLLNPQTLFWDNPEENT